MPGWKEKEGYEKEIKLVESAHPLFSCNTLQQLYFISVGKYVERKTVIDGGNPYINLQCSGAYMTLSPVFSERKGELLPLPSLLCAGKNSTIEHDLRFIFAIIHQNKLPEQIKHYSTNVYLFCLHKDINDLTKLRPLGIQTAIRRLIASYDARTLRDKFTHHLLPYNLAVGVSDSSDVVVKAMQLAIEKIINLRTPPRAATFFDLTNQFNNVSREEFKHVIATSFPKFIPLVTLFYDTPNNVHFKWTTGLGNT